MALRLHNTLTRRPELFAPIRPGVVGMYACGVTVYDLCHIGHARSALVFEVLRRYLEYRGYRVTFVRNFTDVDDKIILRARERGVAWDVVAGENIAAFSQDMAALGLRPADIEPKATDHIPEMLSIIVRLQEKGLAYSVASDVYFSVRDFPGYGRLSQRSLDDLLAGARIDVDERKRDPLDFALWKASRPGEPAWDSPWGPGRPGWHIECSAMAAKYLGDSFDIHAGGEDLIFPHHENEIAQSEGATGCSLARYWLHNGFVTVRGEKMSKSLGNFVTIRDALDRYAPDAVKLLLLSTNYRAPLDYTEEAVVEKGRALAGLQEFLQGAALAAAAPDPSGSPRRTRAEADLPSAETAFCEAMDDDLNTARATGVLFDMVREGNRLLHALRQGQAEPDANDRVREMADLVRRLGGVLALEFGGVQAVTLPRSGVALRRAVGEALAELDRLLAAAPVPDLERRLTALLLELLAHREAARTRKAWGEADAVRRALAGHGIRVDDAKATTQAVVESATARRLPPLRVTLLKD
jgi:cysteinyl-tRNA synthetase